MKRSISLWQFIGFAVTAFAGTLLHFLYDWTGKNIIFALFSAVNESTWEHMKLLFFPMFVFAIIEGIVFGKEYDNFWCIKFKGILLCLTLIPTLFYTYNGIFGKSPDWINITIFFVAAAAVFIYETRQFSKGNVNCRFNLLSFVLICLIALAFIVFTFIQPKIPFFQDPTTNLYGIQ